MNSVLRWLLAAACVVALVGATTDGSRLSAETTASHMLALVSDEDDDKRKNKDAGLRLVSGQLPAMLPGQTGWVSVIWAAEADVCDVEVTASGAGLDVSYPANTASFSSFYTNSALAETNLDYTAFKVSVPANASTSVSVTLQAAFRRMPPGQIKKTDDLKTKQFKCSGPKGSTTATAALQVEDPTGPAVILETRTVTVDRDAPSWVELRFRGNRAGLDDFRARVEPPPDLLVTYPNDADSAGLSRESTLPVAGEDHVAIRLDARNVEPGVYRIPVTTSYAGGSYSDTLTLTVR